MIISVLSFIHVSVSEVNTSNYTNTYTSLIPDGYD